MKNKKNYHSYDRASALPTGMHDPVVGRAAWPSGSWQCSKWGARPPKLCG
eukprot:COSAG01_NODE_56391_length_318_cov_4.904110_1_plen_49_part_10